MKQITPQRAAIALALLALLSLPVWVGNTYYINIASQILLWAVLALALNVLVGYAGLTSLGHAGLFAVAGYAAALMLDAGHGHFVACVTALVATIAMSKIFAVLALRATGIGFLMITLAIGQILWGIAYRWASLTNGDNGINVATRPAPFGLSLSGAPSFYYATLLVFLVAVVTMAIFVRSPFGASLAGTRDQPRRMTALGYNVWLIRYLAIVFSGFWSGVAGLLFLYYNQFISPQVSALTTSAEALLMVISGGSGTLLGPIFGAAIVVIMKNVVSAYIERWNLVLGADLHPHHQLHAGGPGAGLGAAVARRPRSGCAHAATAGPPPGRPRSAAHDRAHRQGAQQVVRRPARHRQRRSGRGAGRAAADHRPQRRRQDHAVQPDHRRDRARQRLDRAVRPRHHARAVPPPRPSRDGAHLPDHHAVCRATPSCATSRWRCWASRRCAGTRSSDLDREHALDASAPATRSARVGLDHIAERPLAQTSYGERRRVEIAMALAQAPKVLLLDEPFAGLSVDERRDVQKLLLAIPREVTVVMIEHNMDVALDFADRITLLHFGEVIVEGTRAQVVADPRTREVYLGA